jgi:hypothetical protein
VQVERREAIAGLGKGRSVDQFINGLKGFNRKEREDE